MNERLTARALAYWFIDDGASTSKKSISRTYRFNTQSFQPEGRSGARLHPLDDQQRLVEAWRDNLSISATIQKFKVYRIREPFCQFDSPRDLPAML